MAERIPRIRSSILIWRDFYCLHESMRGISALNCGQKPRNIRARLRRDEKRDAETKKENGAIKLRQGPAKT
jgi:hypothetical protein